MSDTPNARSLIEIEAAIQNAWIGYLQIEADMKSFGYWFGVGVTFLVFVGLIVFGTWLVM